jgi:hypothetical protein
LHVQPQRAAQLGEEALFAGRLNAVGVADADRHLEGELARFRTGQRSDRRRHRDALEQHVLVERGELDRSLAGERVGDPFQFGTFAFVLVAIGESGHQAEGEDGALFLLVHLRVSPVRLRLGAASIHKFPAASKAGGGRTAWQSLRQGRAISRSADERRLRGRHPPRP